MITNEQNEEAILEWMQMRPEQKRDVKRQADEMRAKVRQHWIARPLNDSMENYWDASEKLSLTIAAEFYNKPEASYALELAILKAMLSPEALAWDRTCLLLSEALNE